MVDEVREILIRWTTDASEVLDTEEQIRSDINLIKAEMLGLKSISGETNAVLKETFRQENLDVLISRVKQLKNLISTKEKRSVLDDDQIERTKAKIAELTVVIKRMQAAIRAGTAEIGKAYKATDALSNSGQKAFINPTQKAQLFTANVAKAKGEIYKLINAGHSLESAMVGLKDGTFTSGELSQALKEVKTDMGQFGEQTDKTSSILKRIFAAGAIGFALQALRGLIDKLREATEQAVELSRSVLDIAINARALAREGGELLPSEWIQTAKDLSKIFSQFSQQDINSAVSQLIRLGRQAQLTDDQIQSLIENTLTLATVTGQDAATAANAVATAVESGYARGLKEVVGAINETTIAGEAMNRGLAETEDEVNKNVRAITVLALLEEEAGKVAGDLDIIMESLAGQYTANKNELVTLTAELGTRFLPTVIEAQGAWLKFLTILDNGVGFLTVLSKTLNEFTSVQNVVTDRLSFGAIWAKNYAEELSKLDEGIKKVGKSSGDVHLELDSVVDAYDDLFIKLRESIIDGNQAIDKENTNFFRKLMEDALKYALKIKQLADKLAFDRAKIERDFRNKVSDIEHEARKKELDAEEKYQEKLRKLRNKFLLDLEDALQERDAKQILRLIREYNSRKDELGRQREGERKDAEQERRDELEDLKKQRDRRLQELDIEYKFRKAKMQEEWELENKLDWERHNQKLQDLEQQTDQRNDEILRRFSDEYDITDEWAKKIGDRLNAEFGPNGRVEQIYNYMLAYATQVAGQLQASMAASGSFGPWLTDGITQEETRNIQVESPVIPPPNNYFPRSPTTSTPSSFVPSSSESLTQIEVVLSPDLEARVIDQTKSDIADVFIRASK